MKQWLGQRLLLAAKTTITNWRHVTWLRSSEAFITATRITTPVRPTPAEQWTTMGDKETVESAPSMSVTWRRIASSSLTKSAARQHSALFRNKTGVMHYTTEIVHDSFLWNIQKYTCMLSHVTKHNFRRFFHFVTFPWIYLSAAILGTCDPKIVRSLL